MIGIFLWLTIEKVIMLSAYKARSTDISICGPQRNYKHIRLEDMEKSLLAHACTIKAVIPLRVSRVRKNPMRSVGRTHIEYHLDLDMMVRERQRGRGAGTHDEAPVVPTAG